MKNEVLYYQRLYIPLNIRYPQLFKECEERGITVEKTHITRVFDFYAESEADIRYIRTKNILKEWKQH